MTDIRTRLVGALREKLAAICDSDYARWADHFADVLLSLPGIAIVELPEPDSNHYDGEYGGPADRPGWLDICLDIDGVDVSVWNPGEVQIGLRQEPLNPICANDARKLAAALLAAANATEGK